MEIKTVTRWVPRPTFGRVVGGAAVLVLLSAGSAYAANEWTGANIVNGSLTGVDLANETITSAKIKNGGVTGADLADLAVGSTDVADDAISSAKILNGTITAADLKNNSVTSTKVPDFGLSNQDIGVLTAEVNGDGSLAASSGDVTSTSIGTGNYEVDFGRNVESCTAVGTVGPATFGSAQGELNVADRAGNPDAVFVDTNNSDGSAANLPFRLVVVC